jgi:hypothetical protein
MCDPFKQYISIDDIVTNLKLNDHLSIEIENGPELEYTVTKIYDKVINKKIRHRINLKLYNNESVKKFFKTIDESDENEKEKVFIKTIEESDNPISIIGDDLEIYIEHSYLIASYDKKDMFFQLQEVILSIKCLKPVMSVNIIDLYNILPKNFISDERIVKDVMIFLQDKIQQNKIINDVLLKCWNKEKIHILDTISIAPDMVEHKCNEREFDRLLKKISYPYPLVNTFYYKMITNSYNFLRMHSNYKKIKNDWDENEKNKELLEQRVTEKYYKMLTETENEKKIKLLEPVSGMYKYEYDENELKLEKLENDIRKDAEDTVLKDPEMNRLKNKIKKDTLEFQYLREDLNSTSVDGDIKPNTILYKNISLLSNSFYIQPIIMYSGFSSLEGFEEYSGTSHIVNILIDTKNKIAYYIDSESDGSTAFITTDPFTGISVLVTIDDFLYKVKKLLKKHNINTLLNIRETMEFCPYVKRDLDYVGAQFLNKDSQCQTWSLYYVIMFILNSRIPKGIISKMININHKERLIQFTNYIYKKFIKK